MATNGLWQRKQIGFLPRNTSAQQDMSKLPPSQLSSQLQFNMGIPALAENMATHFTKPKPIVIEKLDGPKPDIKNKTFISRIPENFPLANTSSLSSDRLAFAVNLAKRDIKRAKLMPAEEEQVYIESPTKVKVKRSKKEDVQPKETMRHRVHKSLRHYDKEMKKAHGVHFYPSFPRSLNDDSESNHAREIRKLRKELNLHLKQLHDLQQNRPIVLQNKDKRLKSRKENVRLSDDEIDDRQIARTEEQTIRSSRILYTLQRQIRDLQNELDKKGKNIKHTKKSQSLHRLASAHRAALRALQTFISQTPLHSKASNGGPDMYQDLAKLVQQLSLLTAQLQVDTEEELIDDLAERHGQHYQYQRDEGSSTKHGAFFKDVDETSFKQPIKPSPPTRDRENKTMKKVIPPHSSPERDAVLRAGLEALVRAREEALNAEKSKMKSHVAPSRSSVLPAKKSVLLPAPLKAKRQRIHQAAAVQRLKPADIKQAGFAKATVSSTLRKIETADEQPPKSPPRTPTKCPQRGTPIKNHGSPERLCEQTPQLTPKSQSRQPEEELKSPRNTKYQRQMLPEERKMVEREIERQLWLDKEADLRMQELEDEMRRNRHHPGHSSDGVRLARQMIQETEEAIMNRLKPLLDRAEAIVTGNTKQEEMKKRSLKHQLTDLTARTTMEQAHLLADEILEDILDETVLELQRLEVEEEAEMAVSGLQNQSTIENIMQKLQSFEEGESDIRRYWTRVSYDDITSHEETTHKRTAMEYQPHHPEPIRFSKHKPQTTGNYLDKKVRHLKHRKRFDDPESPTDTGSTASLLEEISTNGSSAVTSQISERHRPPTTESTINLFVPSELRTSIAAYRSRFERFLRDTATHIEGSFDPWKLADQISEVLLDDMIHDVAVELGGVCDEYTENIFTKEFIPATDSSLVS